MSTILIASSATARERQPSNAVADAEETLQIAAIPQAIEYTFGHFEHVFPLFYESSGD